MREGSPHRAAETIQWLKTFIVMNKEHQMSTVLRALGAFLLVFSSVTFAQTVRMESSSAAHPLSKTIADDFAERSAGTKLVLGESGSAEALRRLCAEEADLAVVSRPILQSELAR